MYVGALFFIEYLKYITCTPENVDSKFSTGREVWGPDAIASQAVMLLIITVSSSALVHRVPTLSLSNHPKPLSEMGSQKSN